MLNNEEILNNLRKFISEIVILPSASYEYSKSLQALSSGNNTYEEVIDWYNNQPNVKEAVNQLDKTFREIFNGNSEVSK